MMSVQKYMSLLYEQDDTTELIEISGVPARYSGTQELWSAWNTDLNTVIPVIHDIGWTERLSEISISDYRRGSAGYYNVDKRTVSIKCVPENHIDRDLVVSATRVGALLHELVHHAHITLNEYDVKMGYYSDVVAKGVVDGISYCASQNQLEFVAETGVAIALGRDVPESLEKKYEDHNGPMGVYEIRDTLPELG